MITDGPMAVVCYTDIRRIQDTSKWKPSLLIDSRKSWERSRHKTKHLPMKDVAFGLVDIVRVMNGFPRTTIEQVASMTYQDKAGGPQRNRDWNIWRAKVAEFARANGLAWFDALPGHIFTVEEYLLAETVESGLVRQTFPWDQDND